MHEHKFSNWTPWHRRDDIKGNKFPGVYAIHISENNIANTMFSWHGQIAYIGMTNATTGLKGRLRAFDNTINGKRGHGGADRFRFKHQNYEALIENLYVSISPFECDVKTNSPSDLLVMGDVVKFEYEAFAEYVALHGALPEFNDKKRSKKYSLTYARKNY